MQLIDIFGGAISYVSWMLICFVELALPLFVVALILHLWCWNKKHDEWGEDVMCTTEKVVRTIILIVFPPMASFERGIRKALMTLLMQFVGFIAAFSLGILMHKILDINFEPIWWIIPIFILSWGTGILYEIIQKKKSINL